MLPMIVKGCFWRTANRDCISMTGLFAEQLRNMPPEPLSEIVDDPRWAGSAGGSAQVFHIGTPSASEHTATEGNGSSVVSLQECFTSSRFATEVSFPGPCFCGSWFGALTNRMHFRVP